MRYINPSGFHVGDKNFFGAPNVVTILPFVWVSVPSPTAGEAIVGITSDGAGRLWIADDLGNVYVSFTGGASWALASVSGVAAGNTGNIVYDSGHLMVGGNGAPAALSTDLGVTWTPVTATPNPFGAWSMAAHAGRWTGWSNISGAGVVDNHGYSLDGGATWITPGAGGFPSGDGVQDPNMSWDGAQFITANQGDGIIGFSPDGINWTRVGTINYALIVVKIGTDYILGAGGPLTDSIVQVSNTLAGLQASPLIPVPTTDGNSITAIAGSVAHSAYVAGTFDGFGANAQLPQGPWVACDLKFQVGEQVVQMLFDPLSSHFVAVGGAGSISISTVL